MSNSDLILKYFSAYENKDRKAVESLLSNDFVFTSPSDHRINRETSGTMINACLGVKHKKVRIPACLPIMAFAMGEGRSNG